MKLVLGLGNPGRAFARGRHNVGFWCIDSLARKYDIRLGQRRRVAVLGEGSITGEQVVLARPRTFMNRSGLAARYLLDRFRIDASALLVVYDDMDLPVGKLRIRPQGSSAGHKGMESIIAEVGTVCFPRLRIGIGRPQGQDAVPFVLGPFSREEAVTIRETIDRAVEAVAWITQHGLAEAMDRYN